MEFVFQLAPESLIFWLITATWASEPWVLRGPLARVRSRSGTLELVLILLAMLIAFSLAALAHRFDLGVIGGWAGELVRWSGLLLLASGVGLRFWAGKTLGRWFTRDVVLEPDHRLVTRGPYSAIRHPLYAALLLISTGLGLLFRTPLAAILGALLVSVALVPRIRREERLLERQLGAPYRQWAAGRARLVPRLL